MQNGLNGAAIVVAVGIALAASGSANAAGVAIDLAMCPYVTQTDIGTRIMDGIIGEGPTRVSTARRTVISIAPSVTMIRSTRMTLITTNSFI